VTDAMPPLNVMLLQLAIQELPVVIELVRQVFVKHNPTDPPPTDGDVMAAFNAAYESSLAKDHQWLAAHPEDADHG
jgi:hypothetical protein